jgi:AcrR family transcriptional regulator
VTQEETKKKKTDARVRYTKHIISQTFVELLKEKPVNRITVKEICDRADINRGTFYKHYLDVYDLLAQLEDAAVETFKEELLLPEENGQQRMASLLRALKEPGGISAAFVENQVDDAFMQKLAGVCSEYMTNYLCANHENMSSEDAHWYYRYIAGGAGSLIQAWVADDGGKSAEEMAALIMGMNDRVLGYYES